MNHYSITLDYHGELIIFDGTADTEAEAISRALAMVDYDPDTEVMSVYEYPKEE